MIYSSRLKAQQIKVMAKITHFRSVVMTAEFSFYLGSREVDKHPKTSTRQIPAGFGKKEIVYLPILIVNTISLHIQVSVIYMGDQLPRHLMG